MGHGNETYNARLWNSDVAALSNPFPYFMYSEACLSGAFDRPEPSIAEEHLIGEHGAVAVVMNARMGWYVPGPYPSGSHFYAMQFWDALFRQHKLHFGEASQDAKDDNLFRVSGNGMYRWLHFGTTLLGDPETSLQGLTSASISGTWLWMRTGAPPLRAAMRRLLTRWCI